MISPSLMILEAYMHGLLPRRLASGAFWRLAPYDVAVAASARTARVCVSGTELTVRLPLCFRQNWTILFGRWGASDDALSLKIFEAYARRSRSIWDVGANVGLYFLTAAVTAPAGAVVTAFEPQPGLAAMLRDHVHRNRFASARVVEVAASDRVGEAELTVPASDRMATLVPRFLEQRELRALKRHHVRLLTLDGWADEIAGYPDLLKIDVEGHEEAVIKGAETVLTHRPTLLLEISRENSSSPVVASLFEYGYCVSAVTDRMTVAIQDPAGLVAYQERATTDTVNYLFTMHPL